jgi:Predicted transcriptional regulator
MYSEYQNNTVRENLNVKIKIVIKRIMDKKGISIAELSHITGLRYETVKGYYYDTITSTDKEIKSILCQALNCFPSDIEELVYINDSKEQENSSLEKV